MPALTAAAQRAVPALEVVRAPNLAEQAADAIVAGIASGALLPGQRLFEAELAGQLQMSRVPLREALKILEAQGIVDSTAHRGSRVALFDAMRVNQICEARVALERLAFAAAIPKLAASPTDAERLERQINRMEAAAARLDWLEVSKADLEFHREVCRISGNEIVAKLWESLARHVFIVFGHEIRDERDAAIAGPHHRKLYDLLMAGDQEAVHTEIDRHIMRLRR
jgi:DNA-binding GntR family transcriptional regulator